MATLKDIAEACGVSTASVSKALNHAPDIGEETAERIKRTARALGYFPNAAARALKTKRSFNIGVLFEDNMNCGLTHEYFSHVLNTLKYTVETHGYDVTFISSNLAWSKTGYLEHCKYRGCDGVVIASVDFTAPEVEELVKSDIPVVTIDYVFPNRSAVVSDNEGGMRVLTEYICSMGHKKIAFVHGESNPVSEIRLESFRKTLAAHGIDVPEEYIIEARFNDPELSAEATKKLLSLKDRPTCIIYPDDIALLGGMTEIESRGLSIPEDISIAGYDGIDLSQFLRPRVTTLRQDTECIGRRTAELLIEAMESNAYTPQIVTVPGTLLEGGTVKRLG